MLGYLGLAPLRALLGPQDWVILSVPPRSVVVVDNNNNNMPAQSKMKRPAAAEDVVGGMKKGKFVQKTMKKPAAAGGSLKATIGKMKAGCDDEEEEGVLGGSDDDEEQPCQDDDEVGQGAARDKGKGEKFAAMLRSKTLPPHIQHLYEEVAKGKSSPRDFRTEIINSLFERKANGRFELRDDKPLFREAKQIYERKYSKDKDLGYPRSVMKGLYFQNSEVAFQAALDCGDIQEVEDPDNPNGKVKFFAYRKLETGKETGTNHKATLTGQTRANRQQAQLLGDVIASLGWKFAYKSHEKIEYGKLPASMAALLNEAIQAQAKIQADALKLMPKLLGFAIHFVWVHVMGKKVLPACLFCPPVPKHTPPR